MYERNQRRHYRVAEKEISHSPSKGIFITHEKKHKYSWIAAGILFVSLIQGFIIGLIFGKKFN